MNDTIYKAFGHDQHPWMQEGRCVDSPTDMFPGRTERETRDAKAVCGGCDVALDCLTYALDERVEWGVWGGMSETERRAVRRGRK